MNKKQIALKVLIFILIISIVVLLFLQIKCLDIHNDSENGMLFAVAILLNIIPMFAMIILGIASAVSFVLLLAVNNKKAVILSAFIILCIMLPFVVFNAFIDIAAFHIYPEVPIMAVIVVAINVAALIVCRMALNE